jgi:anti-sigma factor RsiW
MERAVTHNTVYDELEDGALLAYVDGAVDAATRQRIERELARSPELQAELDALARMQRGLSRALTYATSPTQLELGEYVLGMAAPEAVAVVERAVVAYPHLAREVSALREYLADLDLPPAAGQAAGQAPALPLRERVRLVVARLVEELSGAGGASPALAGVRGGPTAERVYQIEDGQLIVAMQENSEQPQTRDILGLAIGLPAEYEYWVSLYQAEQMKARATMDAYGNFVINGVQPDLYALVLSSVAAEIVVPALHVE